MNTFRFNIGIHSFCEARMLRMSSASDTPHELPAPKAPGELGSVLKMNIDQTAEEVLPMLQRLSDMAHKMTDETVNSEIARIVATAQRDLDAIAATPGASQQFIPEYLQKMNTCLHGQGRHMSVANGQVRISPYNPTVFPPEVIARKNRINELQGQLNQVGRNIHGLMRNFSQNALRYRSQKGFAMNRRNIAPEINRFLMQFPQLAMQSFADPLHQLYALQFQLQQELEGVKSGRVRVSVPVVCEPDPRLPMPPHYVASASGEPGFHARGAPANMGPDGAPTEELPTPAETESILRNTERWRNAQTEEERMTIEGNLMMDGVDVDASDLQKNEIVFVPADQRGIQFFLGLITVLRSFVDRMGKKKTEVEDADISETNPSEMTPEQRTAEEEENDKKLTDFKDQKTKAKGEIEEIDKKLNALPPPGEEMQEKLKTDLKNKKEEAKNIEKEIKKLEERNEALKKATEATGDAEEIPRPEPQNGDGGQSEMLNGDPVIARFAVKMKDMKNKMIAELKTMIDSEDFHDVRTSYLKAFGVDPSLDNMKDFQESARVKLLEMPELIHNMMSLEKNEKNQYRLRMDFGDFHKKLSTLFGDKPGAGREVSRDELERLALKMSRYEGPTMTVEGTALVSDFMSDKELMALNI